MNFFNWIGFNIIKTEIALYWSLFGNTISQHSYIVLYLIGLFHFFSFVHISVNYSKLLMTIYLIYQHNLLKFLEEMYSIV